MNFFLSSIKNVQCVFIISLLFIIKVNFFKSVDKFFLKSNNLNSFLWDYTNILNNSNNSIFFFIIIFFIITINKNLFINLKNNKIKMF